MTSHPDPSPGQTPGAAPPYPYQQPYPYQPPPPQTPQGTNGFAIAALVLSICGGFLLGLIFGIVALVQTRRTGQKGRGMAIASVIISSVGMVVAAAAFAVLVVFGVREANLHPAPNDLQVDQCLADLDTEQVTYTVTGCELPHNGQVFAKFDLPDAPALPTSSIEELGNICFTRLESYSPSAATDATIEMFYLHPSGPGWAQGDRTVICIAVSTTGNRVGSLRA